MANLEIKLVRSPIACNKKMRATVKSLGLRKMGAVVQQPDTPATWGKVRKVSHLVSVLNKAEGANNG